MKPFEGYIAALYPDLQQAFEGNYVVKDKIFMLISKRAFDGVQLVSQPRAFKKPFVDIESKRIVLDEGFLSYIWCVAYFTIGIADIYQEKMIENPTANITRLSNHPKYRLLDATLGWGRSLRDEYTAWPDYLPNPTQDSELIIFTNKLWLFIVRYIMYHELGHLALHIPSIQLIKESNSIFFSPTTDERARLRMMEIQADQYSLDCLLSYNETDYDRYLNYLGAAVAYIGGFYLLYDGDTRGNFHPDIDVRLQHLLKKAAGLEGIYLDLLTNTVNIGLQVFMELANIEFIEKRIYLTYHEFGDLQNDIFEALSEVKIKYQTFMPFINHRNI